MSVLGTKWRPGTVFSSFETSSFFSCTSRACDRAIWSSFSCVAGCARSADRNRFRFVALGARQVERKYAVAAFGADAFGIDLDRHGNGPVEVAGHAFAPVQAGPLAILYGFGAGDADRVALDLYLQVFFAHARHLGDDDDIVALAKHIEQGIRTAAARVRTKPTAGAERVKRLLELSKRVARIG